MAWFGVGVVVCLGAGVLLVAFRFQRANQSRKRKPPSPYEIRDRIAGDGTCVVGWGPLPLDRPSDALFPETEARYTAAAHIRCDGRCPWKRAAHQSMRAHESRR